MAKKIRNKRKKGVKRTKTLRLSRPLQPKVFLFKRTVVDYLDVGAHPTTTPVTGFNNTYAESTSGTSNSSWTVSPIYTLSDLHAYSEFQNLFTHYKLNGVNERYFLSNNPATAPPVIATGVPGGTIDIGGTTGLANYYNPSILMDSWYNPVEVTGAATANDVYQIQRRKRRVLNVMGKKMFSKIKQLTQLENKSGAADINVIAKKNMWIPCEHVDVPHYGQTHWIRASTGTSFMPHVTARIERTYYISCRGVR